jgi:hypothetical protein
VFPTTTPVVSTVEAEVHGRFFCPNHRHLLFRYLDRQAGHFTQIGDRHLIELVEENEGFTVADGLVMVLPTVAHAIPMLAQFDGKHGIRRAAVCFADEEHGRWIS